jgi:hypothetical protein
MTRRFDPRRNKSNYKSDSIDLRREKAETARAETLAHFREKIAQRAERSRAIVEVEAAGPVRDVELYLRALADVPFYSLDQPETLHASAVYRRLAEIVLSGMNAETQEAVLCWPNCNPSPAAIVAVLALADCGSAKAIEVQGTAALSAPMGLRALIYPYARTSHRPLRHLYVDKEYLGRLHLRHQNRGRQSGELPALADYHKTLARAKTLSGLAIDGKSYAEFLNPSLDDTIPSGPCDAGDARSELMQRVSSKTDLRKISRSHEADDPAKARFYLFGLRANDSLGSALRRLPKPIDIVFVDLTRIGRNRLGPEWEKRLHAFLAEVESRLGKLPTVLLTDDPWAFDRVRFDVLGTPARRRSAAVPGRSSIILAQGSDIAVSGEPARPVYSTVKSFEVIPFAGEVTTTLQRLRTARKAADALGDPDSATLLQSLIGAVSRCTSLPGSLANLSAYVEREAGTAQAADLLSVYRVGTTVAELQQSLGPWAQTHRADLLEICEDVKKVCSRTEQATPVAELVRDIVQKFLRVSSKTVLLFQKDMLADFAEYACTQDSEMGDTVDRRVNESGMLLFLDRAGLEDLANLPTPERNYVKTLIVISPTRSSLMSLLARPWLPDRIIVVSEVDGVSSAARDANRLSRYEELAELKSRFEMFAKRAAAEVARVTNTSVDLNSQIEPVEEIEIPLSGVVNLAGHARPGQPVLKFAFEGGQIVLARPGTKLVMQDSSRTIPAFAEVAARDVEIGDHVCVIGDAFLEMARPLLNITARAAEEIRDYHRLVLDRFEKLPGATVAERLAHAVTAMEMPGVTVQRASYWVDLKEQLDAPLPEVVPHAPRDFKTFVAFMKALSVSESIATRYWTWAVIAQRASRMRAAINFHDAYRSILVETYGAISDNPDRARDVRRLRAAAENFVSVVSAKTEEGGIHAGA